MRSSLNFTIFALFAVSLMGCGLKFGEKRNDVEVAKVKEAECLTKSVSDLKVYFKGDASDQQVAGSFDCLQHVFVAFKNNIRGAEKNSYTAREIATFIEVNFLTDSDSKFSDAFLAEIMAFKAAFLGGSDRAVLKSEIDQVADFVERYQIEFVKLNPYMKLLTSNGRAQIEALDAADQETRFQAAKTQFGHLLAQFTSDFAAGGRSYKIENLIGLAVEILRFVKADRSTIITVQSAAPFLKQFKKTLIGGDESLQGPEWPKLGRTLHEAYFQYLRYEYFLKFLAPEQSDLKWAAYEKIAGDLSSLVESLLSTSSADGLTNAQIILLIEPLGEFFPKGQIDESLLKQLGEIKMIILGDSPLGSDGWSRSDFEKLKLKIPCLVHNAGLLARSLDILILSDEAHFRAGLTAQSFAASHAEIVAAVKSLGQLIEKPYDLENLRTLAKTLANGLLKEKVKFPDHFDVLFDGFIAAKGVLTAEPSSVASPQALRLLLNVGTEAYLNYAEYRFFLSGKSFNSTDFMESLEILWPHVKTTFVTALTSKPTHVFTTSELTAFILLLQEKKIISTQLRAESLDGLFNALWTNILNPSQDRLEGVSRHGFDVSAALLLSNEVEIWIGAQKQIAQIFSHSSSWPHEALVAEVSSRITAMKQPQSAVGLTELQSLLSQSVPMTFNDQGFLQILTDINQYRQFDLTQSNIARVIARVIIRAYARDQGRIDALGGVLVDEIQVAYDQLKPLAVDLDVVDPSNNTFITSRFLESSLFLSVSDGDQVASFIELHHLVLHLLSGVKRAADIKPAIVKNCVPVGVLINGHTRADQECVLQEFIKNESSFAGMPQFLSMRTQFTADDIHEYYLNLLKAAGHVPNPENTVLLSDADLFPHVVQYLEMVYARHDVNRDNVIDKTEALAAFPVFQSLLRDLVKSYKQIKDEYLPGVFVYILKNGRPPERKNIKELLGFIAFVGDKDRKDWNIQSTRLDLGRIFNYIADATKPVTPTPATPTPTPPAVGEPLPQTEPLPEVPVTPQPAVARECGEA